MTDRTKYARTHSTLCRGGTAKSRDPSICVNVVVYDPKKTPRQFVIPDPASTASKLINCPVTLEHADGKLPDIVSACNSTDEIRRHLLASGATVGRVVDAFVDRAHGRIVASIELDSTVSNMTKILKTVMSSGASLKTSLAEAISATSRVPIELAFTTSPARAGCILLGTDLPDQFRHAMSVEEMQNALSKLAESNPGLHAKLVAELDREELSSLMKDIPADVKEALLNGSTNQLKVFAAALKAQRTQQPAAPSASQPPSNPDEHTAGFNVLRDIAKKVLSVSDEDLAKIDTTARDMKTSPFALLACSMQLALNMTDERRPAAPHAERRPAAPHEDEPPAKQRPTFADNLAGLKNKADYYLC